MPMLCSLQIFQNASMKALPKRKGKFVAHDGGGSWSVRLNESPPEKEGKSDKELLEPLGVSEGLNESPPEKEGKCAVW